MIPPIWEPRVLTGQVGTAAREHWCAMPWGIRDGSRRATDARVGTNRRRRLKVRGAVGWVPWAWEGCAGCGGMEEVPVYCLVEMVPASELRYIPRLWHGNFGEHPSWVKRGARSG